MIFWPLPPVPRRALAMLVAVVAVVVAAEIPIRTHRFVRCGFVSSGGCEQPHYWGSPPWAVSLAVVVGLAGLAVAFFLYQPRALQRAPFALRLAVAPLILSAAIWGGAALNGHRAERNRRPTTVDIYTPWWVYPTIAAYSVLAVAAAAGVLVAGRPRTVASRRRPLTARPL
jgi:hypothetical protein